MPNCCPNDRDPHLLSNAPQERPAIDCDRFPDECDHCLLDKFKILYAHLVCGDEYKACLVLNQAESYVGGIMNAALKEQALMFAAAHLLEVGVNSGLEQAQKLTALSQGKPIKNAPVGADFWQSTTYGQAYLSLTQSNPRLGILAF